MRLVGRTFSHVVIPTAIAVPISAAIAASCRYLPVVDVVIAHHGAPQNSQEKEEEMLTLRLRRQLFRGFAGALKSLIAVDPKGHPHGAA